MSKQTEIYNNYVKQTTSGNVEPLIGEKGVMPISLEGEVWTRPEGKETMGNRWGDRAYGPVRVEISNMGRVREIQSVDRGWSFVVAVHATKADYYGYNRALGMFHYLNT